jgi:hypothetical protein
MATASWSARCEDIDADETELVLSLDGGITFPIRITRSLPACTASLSWKVPDVATANARLGLRRGVEGRFETERIVVVSDRFSILSTGDAHGADLTRGAVEWWTDQALFDVAAEDMFGFNLNCPPSVRHGAASEAAADEQGPESFSPRNPQRFRLCSLPAPGRAGDSRPSVFRRSAPVPLRV